ncbi:DsbA family oxidoreductase [Paraburkholderia sp. RL17-337-BIB-A]
MKPLDIEITYDFICPWCWIGHRNLKNALSGEAADVSTKLSYTPFELNPAMPLAGLPRKEYRTAKFGSWARSQAMDADVAAAGRTVGLEFNYDLVGVTPNTRLAHRLMVLAQRIGDKEKTEALFESIFAAYFSRGENIGTIDALVPLAEFAGYDAQEVRAFLSGAHGEAEVVARELDAQTQGVRAVPTVRIGNSRVGGAQPSAIFARTLLAESDDAGVDVSHIA